MPGRKSASKRGGYQPPAKPAPVSGPGALSKRTDGGPADRQPVRPMPGGGAGGNYGDRKASTELEQGAPMAAAPASTGVPPQGGPPMAQSAGDPFGPTRRPDEPVTAGANSARAAPRTRTQNLRDMLGQWYSDTGYPDLLDVSKSSTPAPGRADMGDTPRLIPSRAADDRHVERARGAPVAPRRRTWPGERRATRSTGGGSRVARRGCRRRSPPSSRSRASTWTARSSRSWRRPARSRRASTDGDRSARSCAPPARCSAPAAGSLTVRSARSTRRRDRREAGRAWRSHWLRSPAGRKARARSGTSPHGSPAVCRWERRPPASRRLPGYRCRTGRSDRGVVGGAALAGAALGARAGSQIEGKGKWEPQSTGAVALQQFLHGDRVELGSGFLPHPGKSIRDDARATPGRDDQRPRGHPRPAARHRVWCSRARSRTTCCPASSTPPR
jgi:hypothetical protein